MLRWKLKGGTTATFLHFAPLGDFPLVAQITPQQADTFLILYKMRGGLWHCAFSESRLTQNNKKQKILFIINILHNFKQLKSKVYSTNVDIFSTFVDKTCALSHIFSRKLHVYGPNPSLKEIRHEKSHPRKPGAALSNHTNLIRS